METTSTDSKTRGLERLTIDERHKQRPRGGPTTILVVIGLLVVIVVLALWVSRRNRESAETVAAANPAAPVAAVEALQPGDARLTVSGYIIPRERIEISPRFQATVRTINVRKGEQVAKDQVIVVLEDDEYRARLLEAEGRLELAQANLRNAEITLKRALDLTRQNVESEQVVDDARRNRDVAAAEVKIAEGLVALSRTYLDWCTIRAPIDGVVLEKLVEPNELVVPQSFGGETGPSTAFISMADLQDLQVEIDLNEADINKISMNQPCRVSPEAFPDKVYEGRVAEIAPEANRSKGTLQVKVQIQNPDRFLTPELTARVDFLAE